MYCIVYKYMMSMISFRDTVSANSRTNVSILVTCEELSFNICKMSNLHLNLRSFDYTSHRPTSILVETEMRWHRIDWIRLTMRLTGRTPFGRTIPPSTQLSEGYIWGPVTQMTQALAKDESWCSHLLATSSSISMLLPRSFFFWCSDQP